MWKQISLSILVAGLFINCGGGRNDKFPMTADNSKHEVKMTPLSDSGGREKFEFENVDPSADVMSAIQKKDLRLLGIGEEGGPEVPFDFAPHLTETNVISDGVMTGPTEQALKLVEQQGVREIYSAEYGLPGVPPEEHQRRIKLARKYANEYNRLLLEYLKEQKSKQTKAH